MQPDTVLVMEITFVGLCRKGKFFRRLANTLSDVVTALPLVWLTSGKSTHSYASPFALTFVAQ